LRDLLHRAHDAARLAIEKNRVTTIERRKRTHGVQRSRELAEPQRATFGRTRDRGTEAIAEIARAFAPAPEQQFWILRGKACA
jgi:hypothetical protein